MRILSDDDLLPLATQSGFAAPGFRSDLLNDSDCGPKLRVYAGLTDGRLGGDLTPADLLYNRYFWFRRLANSCREKFGEDAGIEQQAFQILEYADHAIDWSKIEQLETAARTAKRPW